jgi:hypothetical protein
MSVLAMCLGFLKRPPNLEIGGHENPYLRRWYVIPRNRLFNIYLHQFLRDDDDRALHDHPWPNCSILLQGRYLEVSFAAKPAHGDALPATATVVRRPWRPVFRTAKTAHRVVLFRDIRSKERGARGNAIPCWSLFFTGPVLRSWGFWCPAGRWVHWKSFTGGPKGEVIGAGCGDPTAARDSEAA